MDRSGEHHAVRGQHRRRQDPGDDDDERPGHARHALEHEQSGECAHPAREARQLPGGVAACELRQQREEVAAAGVHVHQRRPLLDRDHERQAERIAAQHRAGDQVRHGPEPQAARTATNATPQPTTSIKASAARSASVLAPSASMRRGQHRRRGGGRADDGEAAAADEAVADKPGEQRHDACLGRQVGEARVGHRLRQQQPGDARAREQVGDRGSCCHRPRASYPKAGRALPGVARGAQHADGPTACGRHRERGVVAQPRASAVRYSTVTLLARLRG